ncbi:MAG: hypothetical protein KBC57_08075 [Neisseriaceae bacterium]|nr:hypothetical protein [Neisseriaceae bacterium]MBP6862300.1 hypothetical protein [Neisseriaceae bacterium]
MMPSSRLPYVPQWASAHAIPQILSGELALIDDPLWADSGAPTPAAYAEWASHICGMACLRMILGQRLGLAQAPSLFALKDQCLAHGGYVQDGDRIKGLYYRPFIDWVRTHYGLFAELKEHTPIRTLLPHLGTSHAFMASVHPSIRTPQNDPPHQGGHLILVYGFDSAHDTLTFHNPSGHLPSTQQAVRMTVANFERFYAGRGILVTL